MTSRSVHFINIIVQGFDAKTNSLNYISMLWQYLYKKKKDNLKIKLYESVFWL